MWGGSVGCGWSSGQTADRGQSAGRRGEWAGTGLHGLMEVLRSCRQDSVEVEGIKKRSEQVAQVGRKHVNIQVLHLRLRGYISYFLRIQTCKTDLFVHT